MESKVDKRLQQAVQKGFKEKQAAQQKVDDDRRAKEETHQKEIKKFLPKARAWVEKNLFEKIAKEESQGSRTLILSSYEDGIPSEALYQVIQKIDGLRIWSQEDIIWQDSDYGTEREIRYHIQWTSADPNLNRNDR